MVVMIHVDARGASRTDLRDWSRPSRPQAASIRGSPWVQSVGTWPLATTGRRSSFGEEDLQHSPVPAQMMAARSVVSRRVNDAETVTSLRPAPWAPQIRPMDGRAGVPRHRTVQRNARSRWRATAAPWEVSSRSPPGRATPEQPPALHAHTDRGPPPWQPKGRHSSHHGRSLWRHHDGPCRGRWRRDPLHQRRTTGATRARTQARCSAGAGSRPVGPGSEHGRACAVGRGGRLPSRGGAAGAPAVGVAVRSLPTLGSGATVGRGSGGAGAAGRHRRKPSPGG